MLFLDFVQKSEFMPNKFSYFSILANLSARKRRDDFEMPDIPSIHYVADGQVNRQVTRHTFNSLYGRWSGKQIFLYRTGVLVQGQNVTLLEIKNFKI